MLNKDFRTCFFMVVSFDHSVVAARPDGGLAARLLVSEVVRGIEPCSNHLAKSGKIETVCELLPGLPARQRALLIQTEDGRETRQTRSEKFGVPIDPGWALYEKDRPSPQNQEPGRTDYDVRNPGI
jgi:hypothetical protein